MKSKSIYLVFLVSCFMLLASCKPKQKITEAVNNTSAVSTYIHDKLTPVALPVDSATIRAKFECDSNYNVVLSQLFELKSKNIQSAFDWHDGLLDYKIRTGGDTVYIPGSDFYFHRDIRIKETVTITKTVKVPLKITLVQKFQILCGNLLIILILIAATYFIVKNLIKV